MIKINLNLLMKLIIPYLIIMKKKTYGCEDLQGSIYFAPNVLRHCCQRFFVNGKMQGDVDRIDIGPIFIATKYCFERIYITL